MPRGMIYGTPWVDRQRLYGSSAHCCDATLMVHASSTLSVRETKLRGIRMLLLQTVRLSDSQLCKFADST